MPTFIRSLHRLIAFQGETEGPPGQACPINMSKISPHLGRKIAKDCIGLPKAAARRQDIQAVAHLTG
jgi:hypothetical protein